MRVAVTKHSVINLKSIRSSSEENGRTLATIDLQIDSTTSRQILDNIFGTEVTYNGTKTRIGGLIDCECEEDFDFQLSHIIHLERKSTGQESKFAAYFKKYKVDDCKKHMLALLWRDAGLGENPSRFTTNYPEVLTSISNVYLTGRS